MSDSRREAIVVFGPPDGTDWRRLDRRERADVLRSEVGQRVERMFDDLARAGMAGEVDILDGTAAPSIPAGAVLVRATPRALKMIQETRDVAAVADLDTPLPTWPLTA
jgi:hypothetical protein